MNLLEIRQELIAKGYYPEDIEEKIARLGRMIDLNSYAKEQIEVIRYEIPSYEISRFYMDETFEKILVLEGEIHFVETSLLDIPKFTFPDYSLSHNLCLIGLTKEKTIKIILYLPNDDTIIRYTNDSYEEIYGEERKKYVEMSYESLMAKKILTENKVKEIISMLVLDFVIDQIILKNENPKWKLYHKAEKYAQAITKYHYKYIHKIKNCVETVERNFILKIAKKDVKIGNISNEPFLTLKEGKQVADFSLNAPSYVWFSSNAKQEEELAVYTAEEEFAFPTYCEWLSKSEDIALKEKAEKLKIRFSREIGYPVSVTYILDCLKKLNREMIVFPNDFLKREKADLLEEMEPIQYHYRAITDPKVFESMLYHSIEDDFNGKCKYQFVENVSGLYTLIGNKISKVQQEHCIADFNENANAAILKKETLLLKEMVSQIQTEGIDKQDLERFPVPILEVVFYFPKEEYRSNEVKMCNKSRVEDVFLHLKKGELESKSQEDEIQKEEILERNQEGKKEEKKEEEKASIETEINRNSLERYMNLTVNYEKPQKNLKKDENALNEKPLPVFKNVIILFQDEEGNELKNRKMIQAELGTTFCYSQNETIQDKKGNEWRLIPNGNKPILVTEDERENVVNCIYEVAKAQVVIQYLKSSGEKLFPEKHLEKQVGSGLISVPEPFIYDKENKGWKLSKVEPAMLKVTNENNLVTIVYEEAMENVVWKYLDINGNELRKEEIQRVQIGTKYSPLVKDRVIYQSEEVWRLMEIKPYEIIVSQDEAENIVELIYSNAQ